MIIQLAELIFSSIVRIRNRYYENPTNIINPGVPVISIGNISTGGTGKTPFVIMLANELKLQGIRCAIIGRGYKRKSKGDLIICDGNNILTDAESSGDEMLLMAEALKIPVIVSNKKYKASLVASEKFDIDCILVDDGFQHRKLKRDIDIVIIDNYSVSNPHLLPAGRMREPLESLLRANIICYYEDETKVKLFEIMPELKSYDNNHNKFFVKIESQPGKPYEIIRSGSGDCFNSSSVGLISGIANPERFNKMVIEAEIFPGFQKIYSDHHEYHLNDINKIINECKLHSCNSILTTEKDAVKLRKFKNEFGVAEIFIYAFPILTCIIEGKDLFFQKILSIFNK